MEREPILRFSSKNAGGRLGNLALTLLGPVGFPCLSAGILWLMVYSAIPASHIFGLFHFVILLLFLGAGRVWSGVCVGLVTLVGFLGIVFSDSNSNITTVYFFVQSALAWALMYSLNRMELKRMGIADRLQEEYDRLDIDVTKLSSDHKRILEDVSDGKEQMLAYHRLQNFTDDLIGTYNREELMTRSQKGLRVMFPKSEVTIRLFPKPNRPDSDDEWGKKVLEWSQPKLFPSRERQSPTWTPGKTIFIPLRSRDKIVGWLGLETKTDQKLFQVQDLRLGTIAADLICMALGNADRYAQTESLAISDSLTGIYTRGYFDERFLEEFAKARHKSSPLSLVLADIDFFKKINDVHGHYLGDEVLRWLARFISSQVRQTDFVARYGGEEFIILMPNARSRDANHFAKRLCKSVENSIFRWENKRIRLTISLGISSLSSNVSDEKDLIRRADEALYQAKNAGRNRVCLHE